MTTIKQKPIGFKVPPLSINDLRKFSQTAREYLQIKGPNVDLIKLYDFVLPQLGVIVHIAHIDELKEKHGETFPDSNEIHIREDVYLGAIAGNGRDRFTLAHELGHLFLHSGIALARSTPTDHKFYEDSEWQANTFASEFLMNIEYLKPDTTEDNVVDIFGVSPDAARVRLRKLKEKGDL